MPVDEALRTKLLETSAITDIVGSSGVFIDDAGQSDLNAYIVISQQGHDPLGNLTETTGLGKTELDFDCYAKSRTQVRTLANAVNSLLKDFRGTIGSVSIPAVNWIGEGSDKVASADSSAVHYFVLTETLDIFWSE